MVYCTRRLNKYLGSVFRPHNLFLGKVRHKGEGEGEREIGHSGQS